MSTDQAVVKAAATGGGQGQAGTVSKPGPRRVLEHDQQAHGGQWREDVWDRIGRLVDAVNADVDPGHEGHAIDHLERASALANRPPAPWWFRRGSHIEATWRQIRLAEEALLREVREDRLLASATAASEQGHAYLSRGNRRLVALDQLLATWNTAEVKPEELRAAALSVLVAAHSTSDDRHRRLRTLASQLWWLTAVLGVLAIVQVIAVAVLGWQVLPAVADSPLADGSSEVITGWQAVALAMLAGFVGALFSAIPSLALVPPRDSTFNPIRAQAGLKMAIGAWSGFLGLLAVAAGLSTAEVSVMTIPGFVMVAAVFGAAQEALTRFADRKANTVEGATPAEKGTGSGPVVVTLSSGS